VSDATAVSELLTGGIALANFPGSQLPRVQSNKSIVLHKVPQQGEDYMGFNTARAPFNNPDVRRAISEVIDRSALIKAAYNGLAKPAYSPIPQTLLFYDKNAKNYVAQYNPSAAQKVLSANHVTGPYTLLTFNDSTSTAVAELIQGELQQVGVKVTIVEKSVADYIPIASKGDFDMNYLGWGWPDPDFMYQLFHSSQASGGGLNFTGWKNAESDALIIEGRQSLNRKKAAAAYAKWQRLMDDNAVIDPLVVEEAVYGVRNNVKGWHLNRAGELLFQDMYLGT
jgi:peptide/nickel transport system substrate-binding protein